MTDLPFGKENVSGSLPRSGPDIRQGCTGSEPLALPPNHQRQRHPLRPALCSPDDFYRAARPVAGVGKRKAAVLASVRNNAIEESGKSDKPSSTIQCICEWNVEATTSVVV